MKKNNFSILYFLLTFLFLYYSFYVYVGLISPGGKFYSAYMSMYLNVPHWLSVIIAKAAIVLLKLIGYSVYQVSPENVTIEGSRGVSIAWACLGMGVISAWVAFIVAHKEKVMFKIKWVVFGIVLIYTINILRIVMIALSNHYQWRYLQSFNAHSTFNVITYIVIFILMGIFIFNYNRKTKTYE